MILFCTSSFIYAHAHARKDTCMHQALYRKWRPKSFDSVWGQEHITSVLRYEIKSGKYSHAYLFCGSHGVGKTTCAKLLSKAVNCLDPQNGDPCGKCEACKAIDNELATDVVEMDAASNTGVDYIRDIRETVMYAPSALKNRVYIIDEVHMLTQSAFNALLKTLEEPPSNVVFILATTEQQKIPATILSRCQKFEFRKIASQVIADRLTYIAENEDIKITPDAAKTIAKMSQGGMRDAISLLELCAGDGKEVTVSTVKAVTGALGRDQAVRTTEAIISKDMDAIFAITEEIASSAKEISVFWQELADLYRDMLVFKTTKEPSAYLDLTADETETLSRLSESLKSAAIMRHCKIIENAFTDMQRNGASKRICAEMALLKMCDEKLDTLPEGIVARISALEEKIAMLSSGAVVVGTAENAEPPKKSEPVMFKKSVSPEKIPETVSPAESKKPVRTGLKPVTWWIEAVKRTSETNPSMAPFMKLSRAYEDGNKILIRVEGGIAAVMLDTPEMKKSLSELSAVITGTPVPASSFEFREVARDSEASPIDELTDGFN